jgi:hypothetical protein
MFKSLCRKRWAISEGLRSSLRLKCVSAVRELLATWREVNDSAVVMPQPVRNPNSFVVQLAAFHEKGLEDGFLGEDFHGLRRRRASEPARAVHLAGFSAMAPGTPG